MSKSLESRFVLHTIEQVAELVPQKTTSKKKHVEMVEQEVVKSGFYKKLGDQILMTDQHLDNFFNSLDADTEATGDGDIIFVCNRSNSDEVYINWAPAGKAFEEADKIIAHRRALGWELTNTRPATHQEWLEYRERIQKYWAFGDYYNRKGVLWAHSRGEEYRPKRINGVPMPELDE